MIQVQEFLSETYQRTKKGAELYLRTIKASFNREIDWGYITSNPFKKVKFKKGQKKKPSFITRDELQQVLEKTKSERMRNIFIFHSTQNVD